MSVTTTSDSWATETLTYRLPEAYRPGMPVSAPLLTTNGASTTGMVTVNADGTIVVRNAGGAGSSDSRSGFVMYPIGF